MAALRVSEVGEAGLLKLLPTGRKVTHWPIAIGDDAAIFRPPLSRGLAHARHQPAQDPQSVNTATVLSTDMLIEGVDFDFAWASWRDVGHKAAAVNLSDLAAMGAAPRGLLLSLALRRDDSVADVKALLRGFTSVAEQYNAPLVGGDFSETSGPVVLSVTAVGSTGPHPANWFQRGTAKVGDAILVSGSLGDAACGLRMLQSRQHKSSPALVGRQLRPHPQVALAQALARSPKVDVHAAVDVSDGLAKDVLHLANATKNHGVQLELAALPLRRSLCRAAHHYVERSELASWARDKLEYPNHPQQPWAAWHLALFGGEDFELLCAVPSNQVQTAQRVAKQAGQSLTQIGTVTKQGPGLWVQGPAPQCALARVQGGFNHFS